MKKMKIGIPGTLFAAYHLAYWYQFITLSGMEVVLSDESTKEIADQGGRVLPHEFCIPVKVFIGHILNLVEKGVDQILVPRMTTQGKSNYFCPKLIGLPEIVHYTTGLGEERMFSPEIICNGLQLRVTKFPAINSTTLRQMKVVAGQANKCWERILANCREQKITLPEATGRQKMGDREIA
jgi:predicted nucleotide-binding protein (sugar kinase/HSP70/actin superfamily)